MENTLTKAEDTLKKVILQTSEKIKELEKASSDFTAVKEQLLSSQGQLATTVAAIDKTKKELDEVNKEIELRSKERATYHNLASEVDYLTKEKEDIQKKVDILKVETNDLTIQRDLTRNELNLASHHLNEQNVKIKQIEFDMANLLDREKSILNAQTDAEQLKRETERLLTEVEQKRKEFIEDPKSAGFYLRQIQFLLEKKGINFNVIEEVKNI